MIDFQGSTDIKPTKKQLREQGKQVSEKPDVFLMYCPSCGRFHRMTNQPCPTCQGRGGYTPQPVSERVADQCQADYSCDGCMAYREHEA